MAVALTICHAHVTLGDQTCLRIIQPLTSSMAEPVAGPSTTVQTEPADVVMTESPPLVHPRPVVGKAPPERPLNVKDALSYLNAVKVQFQHKPDVYNLFLDIMKDFKGQLWASSPLNPRSN